MTVYLISLFNHREVSGLISVCSTLHVKLSFNTILKFDPVSHSHLYLLLEAFRFQSDHVTHKVWHILSPAGIFLFIPSFLSPFQSANISQIHAVHRRMSKGETEAHHVLNSRDDLCKDQLGLQVVKLPPCGDSREQVSTAAVLHDQIQLPARLHHLIKAHYVGVAQLLHAADL